MSYLCISHAKGDQVLAERFSRELNKYGFHHVCMDETTPKDERDTLFEGCEMLLVLTSPVAAAMGFCATDIRRAAGSGRPCVCISLAKNELDDRFGEADEVISIIPYPAGETDTPDERSEALFIHRLYIKRLSCLIDCFSSVRCVDDAYGRAITYAHKARLGDAEAQYALGQAYANGTGVPVLESEAGYWIGQAAQAKHADALIRMGELRLDGEGVERDPAEALRLFSTAAQLGDARGQFCKGICCLYGYGVMKDPEMALRYFRAAAGAGYIPAYYRLGLLYRDGLGTEANRRLAIKYLYIAAVGREEHPPYLYGPRLAPDKERGKKKFTCVSMRFMRQKKLNARLREEPKTGMGMSGERQVGDDSFRFCKVYAKAQRSSYPEDLWLSQSADDKEISKKNDYSHQTWNPAWAESALGRLLEVGSVKEGIHPSSRGALMWYRRSLIHGHVGAVFRLGDAYRSGAGVPADRYQGVKLFRRAAELGSRRGQFALGVCCERGDGIAYDPKEAVRWYELAAKGGYAPAQNNLGGCYENGIGVPEDFLAAVEWYNRASAEGEPNAICRLGLCYENGRGVPQNEERAFRLYEDAARQKHPYALYRLGLFYDRGVTVNAQVAYAAHLYERAATGGVGDAAYAMALCCQEGRGIRKNLQESLEWLKKAAQWGSVQGCYWLGMAYLEGKAVIRNRALADDCFARCIELYKAMSRRAVENHDRLYPTDGMTLKETVGKAYYMLGYGQIRDGKDATEALAYFREAAIYECREAMTAVGDLYTFGLISTGVVAEDRAMAFQAYEAAAEQSHVDALLSLATGYETMAQEATAVGEGDRAEEYRRLAHGCLVRGAKLGSVYALIGLAGCLWFGYGVKKNRNLAYDYLRRANGLADDQYRATKGAHKNTLAALWLGDLYLSAPETRATVSSQTACFKAAYGAYTEAVSAPLTSVEDTLYLLPPRLQKRRASEEKAKAEAQYRLAVLGLLHFNHMMTLKQILEPMGAAVLSEHTQATEDLTRLYLYQKEQESHARTSTSSNPVEPKRLFKKKAQSVAEEQASTTYYQAFGKLYYGGLRLLPKPFTLESMMPRQNNDMLPEMFRAPLTDMQKAEALNRLGDRYFYGQDINRSESAAVICYRRAAQVTVPRGTQPPGGIAWAQYSLGYCLLHGLGTKQDPVEAVRWLTAAAKYHGEAAFLLARCHLDGVGVDRSDRIEALKYYRRALKFGRSEAEEFILSLEALIREGG